MAVRVARRVRMDRRIVDDGVDVGLMVDVCGVGWIDGSHDGTR